MSHQIKYIYIIAIVAALLGACTPESHDDSLSDNDDFVQDTGASDTSEDDADSDDLQSSADGKAGKNGDSEKSDKAGGNTDETEGNTDEADGSDGDVDGLDTSQTDLSDVDENSEDGGVDEPDTSTAGDTDTADDAFTVEDAIASIEESDIRADLTYLASNELAGRKAGSEGDKKAIDYIVNKFKEFGLEGRDGNYTQPFTRLRTSTANVIGILPGNDPVLKDEVIVVGGHHDHVGVRFSRTYNGADDNASGVTAIIAMAKAISNFKGQLKRTVVFMAFGAEELGLLGSQYYCNNPWFPMNKTVFMINLDMVGHAAENKMTAMTESSPVAQGFLTEICQDYTICTNEPAPSGSDHDSFAAKGVPVLVLHTGMHDCYHQPCDKIGTIDMPGVTTVAKISSELIYQLAESDMSPRSNFEIPAARSIGLGLDHGRAPFLEN